MTIRRCTRCGQFFKPRQPGFQFCARCHSETRSTGGTSVTHKHGVAHHRTGGVSRLRSERRSVVIRGQKTTIAIYVGLERFLSELYRRNVRVSQLLEQVGVEASDIERLREMQHLKNLAMDLCPALREWLIDKLGLRPTDVLIELYGIYGDEPMTYQALAHGFEFKDEAHARNYIAQMMRRLRSKEVTDELEGLVREVAIAVLRRSHK